MKVVKSIIKHNIKGLSKRVNLPNKAKRSKTWHKTLFELQVKIVANSIPLFCTFFAWILGFVLYYRQEQHSSAQPSPDLLNVLLVSLGIRKPLSPTDLSNLYQLAWPIFVEVIVFGFLATAMLGQFNPRVLSALHAAHQRKHTVVVGYHHLGERIVDHLVESEQPFVVVEWDESKVAELLEESEPVVLGEVDQLDTVRRAGVQYCKEVFLVFDEFQQAVVCCFHIRRLNPTCRVYVQCFHSRELDQYFAEELQVFPFSTSEWATDSISEWIAASSHAWEQILVFGVGELSSRICEYLSSPTHTSSLVHLVDEHADEKEFASNPSVLVHKVNATRLEFLGKIVQFEKVTQIFILWNNHLQKSNILFLTMYFHKNFPQIQIYVRCFDETLADILEALGATVFSTSEYAFSMLQKNVPRDSCLYPTASRHRIRNKSLMGMGKKTV